MEKRVFGSKNQILADVSNYKSLSVVVGSTGVTATNGQGKNIFQLVRQSVVVILLPTSKQL